MNTQNSNFQRLVQNFQIMKETIIGMAYKALLIKLM